LDKRVQLDRLFFGDCAAGHVGFYVSGRNFLTRGGVINSAGGVAGFGQLHTTGRTSSTGSGFGLQAGSASAKVSNAAAVILTDFIGDLLLAGDNAGQSFGFHAGGFGLRVLVSALRGDVAGFG
jgi:hypothetical protein